jgi:peptidoglycan/LPS O-acetylase OafA/YrhL
MIQLFFVLSGFVIYKAYSNKLKNKKDVLRFQFLRFGRLYPVHIVFLVIYIFIELAKFYAQHKLGITTSANSQPFRENTFTALFQNIF